MFLYGVRKSKVLLLLETQREGYYGRLNPNEKKINSAKRKKKVKKEKMF